MGMLSHLIALAGYLVPGGNLAGPLIIWLIKKDTMPFVDREGKESLNFQISMTIYMLAAGILAALTCVFTLALIAIAIVDFVYVILAAMAASKGKNFTYPFTIRFLK